jgi:glycosyltransferase involved in cell wall biosynthesis
MVVEELVHRGHDVTLFASDDSMVSGRLVPYGHRRDGARASRLKCRLRLHRLLVEWRRRVDVIHSFGPLAHLLPVLPLGVRKIQTYGSPLNRRRLRVGAMLGGTTLTFTACSEWLAASAGGIGRWECVYNGIDAGRYRLAREGGQEDLVFLGRLDRIKGVHTAIQVARGAGHRLLLAGTVAESGENRQYFEREIRPAIDGDRVRYVGPVDDGEKQALLGGARALLFPIEWEEPFGLVMIEAMACGTPVVGLRRGAVPEVVTDGIDGFVCESPEEMITAVKRLDGIDREACRRTVERRFSAEVVVAQYERVYRRALAGGTGR